MQPRAWGVVLVLAAAAAAGEEFNDRVARIDAFPREVGRGKTVVISGFVKGAFRKPELIIIAPRGKTYLNRDNRIGETDFAFTVRFGEGTGPYRMEIIAATPDSSKSAARFTIWHGVKRPPEEKEPPLPKAPPTSPDDHDRLVEKRFLRLLNEFRDRIGERPVGWNEPVAARCREHAARMVKARRRMHRFKGVGVTEMLQRDGGGPSGLSGSDAGWTNLVDNQRPFPRPAPKSPGPRTFNYLKLFVLNHESLPVMFEEFFVREAAFRICAADPHCLEVGVGVVRLPPQKVKTKPKKKPKKKGEIEIKGADITMTATRASGGHVYYCVCFVQVNDKVLQARTKKDHAKVLKRAAKRELAAVRAAGIWGRGGKAATLLRKLSSDKSPEVASAAWDGLLLLDEERAREDVAAARDAEERLLRDRRYADAAEAWRPYLHSAYDARVRRGAERARKEAEKAARIELKTILDERDPDARRTALRNLRHRAHGLAVAAEIQKALKGS